MALQPQFETRADLEAHVTEIARVASRDAMAARFLGGSGQSILLEALDAIQAVTAANSKLLGK